MYGVFFLLFAFLSLPIRLDAYGAFGTGYLPSGYFRARVYGAGVRLDWKVARQGGRYELTLRLDKRQKEKKQSVRGAGEVLAREYRLAKGFPPLKKATLALLGTLRLRARMRIGLRDAAATALACALLQSACGAIRPLTAQIAPAYDAAESTVEIRCIARFRMGRIALTAALYLLARFTQAARRIAGGKQNDGQAPHQRGYGNGA